MNIGVPKEIREKETRVAATPDTVKKFYKMGLGVIIEKSAGAVAGFSDDDYISAGAKIGTSDEAMGAEIVLKVSRPSAAEIAKIKKGALLIACMEPYLSDGLLEKLAGAGVDSIAMELIPRISRAQSMDVLSSQANIAGYRAVLEGVYHYRRFCPMMMTSAGSAKAAKVFVLGVGVAGLQAVATAKRLGAQIEAYDVRPDTKEQVQSLGGKFFEVDLGESGTGSGGYAKELSEAGKAKLQQALAEKLMKSDIIITTANVPGRKAPTLVSEAVVKGMRQGSVIVDMAAPSGGNCALTEADATVVKHGVTIVGTKNLAALIAADASSFYSRNLLALLAIIVKEKDGKAALSLDLNDEIISASLVTYQGALKNSERSK